MAEAVARHWLAQQASPLSRLIRVASAGTDADTASPTTPEAITALAHQCIGFSGRSQRLSRELLSNCDIVFTMTALHHRRVTDLLESTPDARLPLVYPLHPNADIDDPLGRGQARYHQLVMDFLTLIPQRLQQVTQL